MTPAAAAVLSCGLLLLGANMDQGLLESTTHNGLGL
jgi:hypothetical protein